MKKIVLLTSIFLSVRAFAGTDPLEISYGPWIQNVTPTSFTVLWITGENTFSRIEAGKDDGLAYNRKSHDCYYETVTGRRVTGRFHSVTVSGLEKGTAYYYRIVGKPVVDDSNPYATTYGATRAGNGIHRVRTLDCEAPQCRFSMVNDIHFNDDRYAALLAGIDRKNTDFIVLNGDIVSFSNSVDTLIKHTFGPISGIAGDFPIFFARGNHETRGREFHLLPGVFPTPTGEFYYTFRQGPVAFIVLDAGEDKPDTDPEYSGQADFDSYRQAELEWLKKTVRTPEFRKAPKKVCIIHIPPFNNKDSWYAQNWIAENFTPILNEAGIDLMLSAHHHRYILAGPGEYGNKFPIVVNSNVERLDFEAAADGITLKTYDKDGKLIHNLNL